ncbi:ABC transporter permease [Bosea caraganae]|uniref:ABC transporter permease n=1 Tax=Bosea caraganae TaxID=2763117 RepID=A0A370KYA7_9HYPH|nr:ABC transporter permease [Bosea caraganae]RDJ19936.1 ABC transporter permease [Bosea caraganae]RDJ23874.1 ABC transporter permease [Bosea caraganae]
MLRLIVTRILLMLLAVFTVLTALFFGIRLGAGDPTVAIQGSYATAESLAKLSQALGLDKPLWQQYLIYLAGLLRGDLGVSIQNGRPVLQQILQVVPYTLDLTFWGVLIGVVIGVPLGFLSAIRRNSLLDHAIRVVTLSGISVPPFIMGYVLIIVFVIGLGLFPVAGGGDRDDLVSRFSYLTLPALSLGLIMTSYVTRVTRTAVLEVLTKDFIRTGRAKGLSEGAILYRHVLRLTLVTLVTLVGLYATITVGSSVVIEVVFSRPGVGQLIVGAISQSDYTVVQGAVIFYAAFVSLVNLAVDLAYAVIDPRISYE